MKRSVSFLFLLVLSVMIVGCAKPSPWSAAQAHGQNRVFLADIDGKTQKCVWVSSVGHPKHKAHHHAHQKGLRILGRHAYDVDVKVSHRGDGRCQVDMLMTTPEP